MAAPTSTEIIQRLRRQQASLASFGSYAFRETDLSAVLNEAVRACAEGLDVPMCKICAYRRAEHDLLVVAGYGWSDGIVGRVVTQADLTSPQGRAYVTGEPVIVEDLPTATDFSFPAFYPQHGIVSVIGVIIKSHDETPYGVLEIDTPQPRQFNQHDVEFLNGFANVLAGAVATRQRAETMAALLAEKQTFAEELKHRVRNNLQLINGMLLLHINTQSSSAQERLSISAISRRIMVMAEVYDQLLGTGLGQTINFANYLTSLCNMLPDLQPTGQENHRIICRSEPVLVGLDTATALGMVVAELVANSFEHASGWNDSLTITITLLKADNQQAILRVHDNGPGFVEPVTSKRHGVGLVRRLIQQVRGTTALECEDGTTWTIRFPLGTPMETPHAAVS